MWIHYLIVLHSAGAAVVEQVQGAVTGPSAVSAAGVFMWTIVKATIFTGE